MADLLEVDLGAMAHGCFTTRGPGARDCHDDPYSGLNLAGHVGDDPQRVARHREELSARLGLVPAQVGWMSQVHSAQVAHATSGAEPTADALVVDGRRPGPRAAAVLVADCVPVLLADTTLPLAAAVHAGRRGMLAGVVQEAVARLRALGASRLRAAIGPCVCAGCYEVCEQVLQEAVAKEPACAARTRWGTPALDIAAGVRSQLSRLGVGLVPAPKWCTLEDERFYSYRRCATTGRQAGIVVVT